MRAGGIFRIKHYRKGLLFQQYRVHNDVTDSGLQYICRCMFQAGTYAPYEDWYMGLIDNDGFSGLSNSDIMLSHSGWTEFADYSDGSRPAWEAVLSSSPATFVNASSCEFTIDDAGEVRGLFICSDSTISGTDGFLWSTATFSGAISVQNGDIFRAQYEIKATR